MEMFKELLRYGTIKTDVEMVESNGYRRIRTIDYENKRYILHMFNGEVIECSEIVAR